MNIVNFSNKSARKSHTTLNGNFRNVDDNIRTVAFIGVFEYVGFIHFILLLTNLEGI